MAKEVIDKDIINLVQKIKKDKDVLAILLFGSYARKKEYARDIDVCIILDKPLSSKEMSKKRLDYLAHAPDKFDIQASG